MKTIIKKLELFKLATESQRETLLSDCMYQQPKVTTEAPKIVIVNNTK